MDKDILDELLADKELNDLFFEITKNNYEMSKKLKKYTEQLIYLLRKK